MRIRTKGWWVSLVGWLISAAIVAIDLLIKQRLG